MQLSYFLVERIAQMISFVPIKSASVAAHRSKKSMQVYLTRNINKCIQNFCHVSRFIFMSRAKTVSIIYASVPESSGLKMCFDISPERLHI